MPQMNPMNWIMIFNLMMLSMSMLFFYIYFNPSHYLTASMINNQNNKLKIKW